MVQVESENVQRGDLACPVHHDAIEWQQISKISATRGVCIICVFIHHASSLLPVPFPSLLLEGLKD
jgi:hypothetical protein